MESFPAVVQKTSSSADESFLAKTGKTFSLFEIAACCGLIGSASSSKGCDADPLVE